MLSGACRRDEGDILVNGAPVAIDHPRQALDLGTRIVYQELNLVPHLSVAENLFLGALPTRWGGMVDRPELRRRAAGLLGDLGLELPLDAAVLRLGLAQRQLVEIAKALASPASVLVMDEPTSRGELDRRIRRGWWPSN